MIVCGLHGTACVRTLLTLLCVFLYPGNQTLQLRNNWRYLHAENRNTLNDSVYMLFQRHVVVDLTHDQNFAYFRRI